MDPIPQLGVLRRRGRGLMGAVANTPPGPEPSSQEDAPGSEAGGRVSEDSPGTVRPLPTDQTSEGWRVAMAIAKAAGGFHGTDDEGSVMALVEELARFQGEVDRLRADLADQRHQCQVLEAFLAEAREAAECVRLRSRVIEDEALMLLKWLNESRRPRKRGLPARVARLQEALRSGSALRSDCSPLAATSEES